MPERSFYGWTMLAALWSIMFLNLGFPAYGPAVINPAMAKAVGLNRETLGNMFSVYMIMSGLPGPLVALSINRFGVRKTLILGSMLTIAGALLMATVVTGGLGGMLCYGLLVGTGVATGAAMASQAGLARWFVRRRSLALAVLYSSGAIGGFVAAPLLNRLIEATGTWRAGWWLLAALSAGAACIALLFVRERPEDLGQVADGFGPPAAAGQPAPDTRPVFVSRREWTFREAARHPSYWLLLGSLIGGSGGYTLFLAHGVVHMQDLGHSAAVGAWAVGIMTISGLIGKAILATFGDRIDPRYIYALFVGVFGIGLVVVVNAHALWQVVLFATCIGIGFGGGIVCLMTVLSNYYGTGAFASLAGLAIAINTTLSAIAPKVAGRLFDQGVGYAINFYFLAAWCFAGAVVLLFMRRPGVSDERH
ncbi:MAG TPA: MFS transporter [Steroidobacteraceae bacterium]|nr:MFS transporter [Steroidobacteraceae bacterium]